MSTHHITAYARRHQTVLICRLVSRPTIAFQRHLERAPRETLRRILNRLIPDLYQ